MTTAKWTGTPKEWDAERDRREKALHDANGRLGAVSYKDLATAAMPPRPVEPPSVTVQGVVRVTWDGAQFVTAYADGARLCYVDEAQLAFCVRVTREELDAIRALRDGPTPQYEVCGWGVTDKDGAICWGTANQTIERGEKAARQHAQRDGGTAHAIYKRVGGLNDE